MPTLYCRSPTIACAVSTTSNVIVADKKVHLQYLDMEARSSTARKALGIWNWASNDQGAEPDVVMRAAATVRRWSPWRPPPFMREHPT